MDTSVLSSSNFSITLLICTEFLSQLHRFMAIIVYDNRHRFWDNHISAILALLSDRLHNKWLATGSWRFGNACHYILHPRWSYWLSLLWPFLGCISWCEGMVRGRGILWSLGKRFGTGSGGGCFCAPSPTKFPCGSGVGPLFVLLAWLGLKLASSPGCVVFYLSVAT